MPDSLDAVYALIAAGLLSLVLVPLTMRLAKRWGAIDQPRARSLHELPTPRLGGLGILAGVVVATLIWLPWDGETQAILAGALLIAVVGALDDIHDLSPAVKLLGQTVAVIIPVAAGVSVADFNLPFIGRLIPGSVEVVGLPGEGAIDVGDVMTVIGIVGVINVINLIDGVDGLAAGVCAISAITLAVIALSLDRNAAGVLAALTAGACLGFLRYGFPPARTFMGDTGSNLLGFLLGAIAVQGSLKTNAVVALFLPLLVLTVPILDTGFVVAKRIKYRRPIYQADRSHFHHRLANIGFSQRRTLAYLYGWTTAMAALALALRFVPYSDDRGNFDFFWLTVVLTFLFGAVAASFYVVYVLEILKLRRFRLGQLRGTLRAAGGPEPEPEQVDEGVARELETGSFPVIDPRTGEFEAIRD